MIALALIVAALVAAVLVVLNWRVRQQRKRFHAALERALYPQLYRSKP